MQPPPLPRRFVPRLASNDDGSSDDNVGQFDDFEYMYYRHRYEYD
jgi:hypothetical protein